MEFSLPNLNRVSEMSESTERAFRLHRDVELRGKLEAAVGEIERVYQRHPGALVSVSGGKDSMAMLGLAAESGAEHSALHWDWGSRLIPRELEKEIVDNIREYVPDGRLLVASRTHPRFKPYPEADEFLKGLDQRDDGAKSVEGHQSQRTLAGALKTHKVPLQIVGLRRGESGAREKKIKGLYGESLGQAAAFPIRNWSAKDVWSYLVSEDVPYVSYYDAVANQVKDGSVRAYCSTRFSTLFDPDFDHLGASNVDGVANWRHRDITAS